MATYAHLVSFQSAGTTIPIVAGDNVFIGEGVNIASTAAYGILGDYANRIVIEGNLFGAGAGIYLPSTNGGNRIIVGDSGSISSLTYGSYDSGNNGVLNNAGTIYGGSFAVVEVGINSRVHNTGLITSEGAAVYFGGGTGTSTLINAGDIISSLVAVNTSSAADRVFNTGFIAGAVNLGSGADLLDSRGGLLQGNADLGAGNDTAYGGSGADSINGGADLDRLRGKLGDDRLDGGLDNDTMTGGADEDEFQFSTALGITNVDTITDFKHGEDTILLDDAIFAALGPDIQKGEFLVAFSGHSATKASHHIIYDNSKGTLWYDVDGKGGTAAVKFAQLGSSSDHPTNLNYHDFAIV
jgi:Ca2+-binding RTX toxin-like protein